MIILFNWYDIKRITAIPEAQVILAYCLYINNVNPLEKKMARSLRELQRKLSLKSIPFTLISRSIILDHENGIISNYIGAEPQSYFTNHRFLEADISVNHKVNYLQILSQRSLSSKNTWIPSYYVDKALYTNPFIKYENDKIHFKLEKTI